MLKRAGYHPIPVNGKIPVIDEWEQQIDASDEVIKGWGPCNTGLLTKYTPTLDCDILNAEAVAAVEKLTHEKFSERGCILTRTGLAPKIAIPFRTDTPFKKISVMLTAPDGSTGQKFEFLGDGQQFVGFGKHPDTQKSYQWNGGGKPGPVRHEQLPLIDEEEARAFVEEAVKLMVEHYDYQRAAAPKANGGNGKDDDPFTKAERDANKTKGGKLNDAALANLAAWVPEIFPAAWEDRGGFRVSPADRGPGDTCHCCGRLWREHQEDISFQPIGIRDYAVGDEGDRKEGKRSPIDIVMEHKFGVLAVDLTEREHTPEFEQAFELLSQLVYGEDGALEEEAKAPEQPAPSSLCLSLKDWYQRDLPDPDCILGEALTTTSRWLLAADTGLGKTLLAIALGMRCAMGLDFLLWPGARPARVLYIDGEMSRRLLRRRLIDEANRLKTWPVNFFALSKEDIPQMQPLNTTAGQKAIESVMREHCGGNIDLIIFDNIMALISGNHAEEDGWAKTMPWIRDLTRRAIGQLWVHHTGHDSSRQYGTKTREWEMDTYIQLLKEENDYTDVSFTLTFRKARERMPTNRDQFADTKVSLIHDEWTWEGTKKREKLSPLCQKFFDALMLATIVNGNVVLSDDYPFTSLEKWQKKCIDNGLIDPASKPAVARGLFSKYKMELITKNWIKCDAVSAWVIA